MNFYNGLFSCIHGKPCMQHVSHRVKILHGDDCLGYTSMPQRPGLKSVQPFSSGIIAKSARV